VNHDYSNVSVRNCRIENEVRDAGILDEAKFRLSRLQMKVMKDNYKVLKLR
jgi:hypothetical protein